MDQMNNQNVEQAFNAIHQEALLKTKADINNGIPEITIGKATCGLAAGALDTESAFKEALAEQGIEARLRSVGCMGHCYAEPVVIIDHPSSGFPPIFYHQVTPGKARMLVKSFLRDHDPLFEYLLGAMKENEMIPQVLDFPRFHFEKRIVMERSGFVDPENIWEYIAQGGYSELVKAIQSDPEEIVRDVKQSGLRGRGGAGFSTGIKWELVSRADVMGMREIPGPIWIEQFWRAIPISFWKEWLFAPMP